MLTRHTRHHHIHQRIDRRAESRRADPWLSHGTAPCSRRHAASIARRRRPHNPANRCPRQSRLGCYHDCSRCESSCARSDRPRAGARPDSTPAAGQRGRVTGAAGPAGRLRTEPSAFEPYLHRRCASVPFAARSARACRSCGFDRGGLRFDRSRADCRDRQERDHSRRSSSPG